VTDNQEYEPVSVSRRIAAPAADIFGVLTDPGRHPDLDGSGMLRKGATNEAVSGVGDMFVMKMHHPNMGDYEMDNYVVEYELNRRLGWEPVVHGTGRDVNDPQRNGSRWAFELAPDGADATIVTELYDCSRSPDRVREAVDNGRNWVESMTKTLEQLDQLCSQGRRNIG
jgi:hypothetical protein